MALLLTNEEVTRLLSMRDCMDAMERAFLELSKGNAAGRPRSNMVIPQQEPGRQYVLKTWDAALPSVDLVGIRITSSMMQESSTPAGRRLDSLPQAPGGGYVGLVLLFRISTLELVAVIQDARLQVMRAGAVYGLAAKYLARRNAGVMGVLGSGGQAREQLTAVSLVRELKHAKVYSPTKANRERFARNMSEQLGIEVIACDTPRQVVEGSDIVAAASTSLEPVLSAAWLSSGAHVTSVKAQELDEETKKRASVIAVQSDERMLLWMPAAHLDHPQYKSWLRARDQKIDPARLALLTDLIAGTHPGRKREDEITVFGNFDNFGLGIAYPAVGAVVIDRARKLGVGREIPAEWFTQNESS
jgi:alanine dehydrogenase